MALSPTSSRSSGSGGSIAVTDGSTTVSPATTLDITSGATVTDAGSGQANVAIAGGATVTLNQQTGTTYTLVLADAGKLVECANASAIVLTVPTNASVAFPVGTVVYVGQGGAGQVSIAAAGGVTLRSPNGAKAAAQWSQLALTQRAANDWIVSGDAVT